MKLHDSALLLSATDLSKFSACRRATLLDREVAYGRSAPAPYRDDQIRSSSPSRTKAHILLAQAPRIESLRLFEAPHRCTRNTKASRHRCARQHAEIVS